VLIPATLPGVVDALRITMGWAWTYLVVAELVAANTGLGYLSLQAMRGFRVDVIFLAILIIGLLGMIMDFTFRSLRRWLLAWAD
jgi:NitT/TauT family transport system permease protein